MSYNYRVIRSVIRLINRSVHCVERRHVRQQSLRGADVRSRLIAANVLLACLLRNIHEGQGGAFVS